MWKNKETKHTVKAFQFTGSVQKMIDWFAEHNFADFEVHGYENGIMIDETPFPLIDGDWLVVAIDGTFEMFSNVAFFNTFEPYFSTPTKVNSSQVDSVAYHDESTTLQVNFKNGGSYNYFNVPRPKFDELVQSKSVGSFLHKEIKGNHEFQKVVS